MTNGEKAYELMQAALGQPEGSGDWLEIDQARIDAFADVSGDHQFIHVDPEACRTMSPWGVPIAHGFLTLSLLPALIGQVYKVEGGKMGVNYGLNKVRFTSPVPVGSKVRGTVELVEVSDVSGGVQLVNKVTVEIEGSDRPALVAEWLTRQYL